MDVHDPAHLAGGDDGAVPFGVPVWEIVLSAVLLLGTFLALTWVAAKIYRIGLLSYGSKPSYKELWKWIRAGH